MVRAPLPLFPLNAVLVPGLVLPLHIFEPRYRQLIEDLLAIPEEDEREFGVIAVKDGRDLERDGLAALYPIGTATVLREAERMDDGRFEIVTTGSRRFRVHGIDARQPLVLGDVEFLDDVSDPSDAITAVQVAKGFRDYRVALSGPASIPLESVQADDLPDDPTVLSYLVTAAMVLPTDMRQELLSASTTGERLALARTLLRRETALIRALSSVPAIDLTHLSPSVN